MLWRNVDSGVLYNEISSDNDMIFIATNCLQCMKTKTLGNFDDIKREVTSGKWAAKYPIADAELQRVLNGIQQFCAGKDVHWITLSRQDNKTFVKMEFNSCTRNDGGIWDVIERLRRKYPEANYENFRVKKLNRYEEDESAESRKVLISTENAIKSDDTFNALVKEMEDLARGTSNLLINLSVFNRLLYGQDYVERFAYAWLTAKNVAFASLATHRERPSRIESKILGTRNGLLLFRRREKGLQLFLVLLAAALTFANYTIRGRSNFSTSEVKDLMELWFLLSISIVLGLQTLVRRNWNILDAINGVKVANNESEARQHYESEEEFIRDVYNRGLAGVVFKDDNVGPLKQPNGLGWYHIKKPMTVNQLWKIGVRTFWRYDGSISVLVRGVKRVALQLSAGKWHVEAAVDTHNGPEVYLLSGSIG